MELNDKNTTPIHEFKFGTPSGVMFELTCKNHLNLRWSTKNPYSRSLHYIGTATDVGFPSEPECNCPFEDLLVIEPYRLIVFSDSTRLKTNHKDEIEGFLNDLSTSQEVVGKGKGPVYVTAVVLL